MENITLDRLLSDAFHGGEIRSRELRLSDEQVRQLRLHYAAAVEPLGGQWYQVTFKGAIQIEA